MTLPGDPYPQPMNTKNDDVIQKVSDKLEPEEVKAWFIRALPEIRDVVTTVAKVDGIDVAAVSYTHLTLPTKA